MFAIVIIISIAFFCEAIFGFGGGLIAVPLLSLLLPIREAVTLVLIFQLCMGLLLLRSFSHVHRRLLLTMGSGMAVGTVAGNVVLVSLSEETLRTFLGIAILLFLAYQFWGNRFVFSLKNSIAVKGAAGIVGGFFQGVIGTGGPILTAFLLSSSLPKQTMRSTLIALFFISSLIRIPLSANLNLLTSSILRTAAIAFPFFILAIVAGHLLSRKVPERAYRYGASTILFISAILLLTR